MKTLKPIYWLATAAVAVSAPLAIAQPQLSGTPDELREFLFPRPHTVNINGEAELRAFKDVARVSLMVTTEERTLEQAMGVNQELRQGLIEDFIAAGIPDSEINNAKFSNSPQFGLFGNLTRYEVNARLEVSVSTEEHLQLLAAAADDNDEVEFENTEFEHSQEAAFEDRVREMALQDVMEQKAYYESSLGLQLQAINFFYGGIRQMTRAMPMVMAEDMAAQALSSQAGIASSAATPIVAPTFDEVEYQTSVTVVFEIVSDD